MPDTQNALYETRLLSDGPVNEDAFEGGHQRVAEAIAGLIEDENGGKAIALSGPYGSGKSTVIRLLEEHFRNADSGNDTRVFIYDAWEHQGDPLRRSFIESLVEFLRSDSDTDVAWAKESAWEDEIEQIANRKEETKIDTEPVLTKWGRRVAVSLFLAPLGLAGAATFAGVFFTEWGAESPETTALWTLGVLSVLALLLFLSPLVVIWCARLRSEATGEHFHLFFQQSRQTTETKTIRTPDPTTIEFQKVFRGILREVLKEEDRRLILVVDNLDRLEPDAALSTWATMRTFFSENGNRFRGDWESQFWLIAPFSFSALEKTFDGTESSREALRSFIDKTFASTFRVAPPVLSDWEGYMKAQLAEAFPEHPEPETTFHSIYRIFRIRKQGDAGIPTPRDIKLFINRIVGLYRQRGEVDLALLAAYDLYSHRISRGEDEITDSSFLDRRIKVELRDDQWQKKFAALHFNVRVDRATQVLIGDRVREALETGDKGETLKDLSKTEGFETVVGETVPEILQEGDYSTIALTAFALERYEFKGGDVERDVWSKLRRGLEEAKAWYPSGEKEGKGVRSILTHRSNRGSQVLERFLRNVSSIDLTTEENETEEDVAADWLGGILPVVRAFGEANSVVVDNLRVPGEWTIYTRVFAGLSEIHQAEDLARVFAPADSKDLQGLDSTVASMISSDDLGLEGVKGLKLMKRVSALKSVQWPQSANALQQRLSYNSNAAKGEISVHLRATIVLATTYKSDQIRTKLQSKQFVIGVSHYLYSYRDNEDILALCVLLRVLYSANTNGGNNQGQSNNGQNHFKQILQRPDSYEPVLESVAEYTAKYGITWNLARASETEGARNFVLHAISILCHERDDMATHVDYLVLTDFPDLIGEAVSYEAFKELVLQADAEGALTDNLEGYETEDWLSAMKAESYVLDIAIILGGENDIDLPSSFRESLLSHLGWVLDEQAVLHRLKDRWSELLNALSGSAKTSALRSLQRDLLERMEEDLSPVLSLFGDVLSEAGIAGKVKIESPTDTVNDGFTALVRRGNPEEMQWLIDVIMGSDNLKEKVDSAIWTTFQDVVAEKFESADDDMRSVFERLAACVEIEVSGNEASEAAKNGDD